MSTDSQAFYTLAPAIASSRYSRQVLVPSISVSGQERVANARVLIIGLGGLGAPASLYLAGAGIGTLGLLDDDRVETSNLHRQIVHRESSVEQRLSKVESAIRGCRELNSEVQLVGHELRLNASRGREVLEIVRQYDIVLDCTDNPATRYLISDVCVVLRKTLVSGAAQRLDGQLLVLNYPIPNLTNGDPKHDDVAQPGLSRTSRGPCYRCVFPTPPAPEMVQSCSEIGVLGPCVGVIGTLMASETLRLIVRGKDEPRKPTMLLYNAWPSDPKSMWRTIGLRGRRRECIACGDDDVLKEKQSTRITAETIESGSLDYQSFCGMAQDIRILNAEQRISADAFIEQYSTTSPTKDGVPSLVIDTREPHEIEIGPKLAGSLNIPISSFQRSNDYVDHIDQVTSADDIRRIVFVCQQGNDSQIAAKKYMDRLPAKNEDVYDVEGGLVAIKKALDAKVSLNISRMVQV